MAEVTMAVARYSATSALSGTGTPESVITAPPGSTWLQTDSTTDVKGWIRWVKATGTGSTGWVAGPEADTGWRNVAAGLEGGWTGNLRLRRIGNTVELRGALNGSSISTYEFYTLPGGFGTDFATGLIPYWSVWNGTAFKYARDNGNQLHIHEDSASTTVYPEFVWTTTASWPTSLPGS